MPEWLQVTDQKGNTITISENRIEQLDENEETTIVHLKSGRSITVVTPEPKLSDLILSQEEEEEGDEFFYNFTRN